jgi:glycosyltransferase involved in cell wall biosynthesis
MDISFVVPTFKSSEFIRPTIESIERACSGLEHEIILVDDVSVDADALQAVVNDFSSANLVVKGKRSNAAESRNIGIERSSAPYVFLLDSDDKVSAEHVRSRLDMMSTRDAGIVFGAYMMDFAGKSTKEHVVPYKGNDVRDHIFLANGDFRTSTISINRNHHKGTAFDPETRKHQDWAFGIRCYDAGENLFYDINPTVDIGLARPSQMSAVMNVGASRYFISSYLSEASHLYRFVEIHLAKAIGGKNREALTYFLQILPPPQSRKQRLVIESIRSLLNVPGALPLTAIAANSARYIKNRIRFL